eukprot:7328022-Prymnesium_polylepis.2
MSPIGKMVDGVGYTGRELQWPSLETFQKAVVYAHDLFCRNSDDMVRAYPAHSPALLLASPARGALGDVLRVLCALPVHH